MFPRFYIQILFITTELGLLLPRARSLGFSQFGCSGMSYSLQPHGLQHIRLPGFPVHHQLLELAQTHVHQVRDAIQPSHPLLSLETIKISHIYRFFMVGRTLEITWANPFVSLVMKPGSGDEEGQIPGLEGWCGAKPGWGLHSTPGLPLWEFVRKWAVWMFGFCFSLLLEIIQVLFYVSEKLTLHTPDGVVQPHTCTESPGLQFLFFLG